MEEPCQCQQEVRNEVFCNSFITVVFALYEKLQTKNHIVSSQKVIFNYLSANNALSFSFDFFES